MGEEHTRWTKVKCDNGLRFVKALLIILEVAMSQHCLYCRHIQLAQIAVLSTHTSSEHIPNNEDHASKQSISDAEIVRSMLKTLCANDLGQESELTKELQNVAQKQERQTKSRKCVY